MGKREETEKQILDAAIQIISEKGYNATKTNEVAALANISEAIIFKYYKTKKGLLTAVIYKAIEVLGRELAYKPINQILMGNPEKTLDEVFDIVIDDRIKLILKNHALAKVLFNEIQYHSDLRDIAIEKVVNPIIMDFKTFIKAHRDAGRVKSDLEDEIILRTIFAGLFAGVFKRVIMDEKFDESELKREMSQVKLILLHGITA